MLSPKTLVLLLILGYPATWAQKGKVPVSPISKIKSVDKFDMKEFSGKWFLLSVASQCSYLKTNNHRVEATFIQISSEKNIKRKEFLSMSTFRKMYVSLWPRNQAPGAGYTDGICWEIKNAYYPNEANKIKGRFILKVYEACFPFLHLSAGKGYAKDVEMVVGDTDYENYAILYYQKSRKISMKLYGESDYSHTSQMPLF
ncbi:complement component C8 gamma chain [Gastrophryne carolinensis]